MINKFITKMKEGGENIYLTKIDKVKDSNNDNDLFYNEFKWKSIKDNITYFFKIRLNTNNTISFFCSYYENKQKNNFEKYFSLVDFSAYKRFKKNEDIRDIYIYLLTMIQDNQFFFNHNNLEIELIIKPYSSSEKNLEFILPKLLPSCKCEICGRNLNGINYLRYLHNTSANNSLTYNTDINNTVNTDEIQNKDAIEKILKEIETLKKENCIKNEQIKNLQKDYLEQNQKLFKENQALKNQLIKYKKFELNKEPIILENKMKTDISNTIDKSNSNSDFLSPNNKNSKTIKLALKRNVSINEVFNTDPTNLKYHSSIIKDASAKGVNSIFEVFTSAKDSQKYLVSKNGKTHNIEIISLIDNKKIKELSYENNNTSITMVRYFLNYKGKKEYLVAADMNKKVIIWDINNDYKILYIINTRYEDVIIYSCCLYFDNFENNYLFTSCGLNRYKKNETSFTKMYSLKDGTLVKNIINSDDNNTYFLLIWFNELDKTDYLIELCEKNISITNFLKNELYAKLYQPELKVLKYYSGFIYTKESKNNYLCCSTSNGCIVIWDLINKHLINYININKVELYNIIQWNLKYAIVSGGSTKLIKIFDLEKFQEVSCINTNHHNNVNCVKKINHPKYGEALLSCGNDHKIKLYVLNDNQE